MKPSPERIAQVEGLKQLLRQPMTDLELRQYRCQVAAVKAEDERKRAPAPQMELAA